MADKSPDIGEPQRISSRKTLRYKRLQQQKADEKRRMILKAGLGAVGLATTGGLVGLTRLFGRQEPTPIPAKTTKPLNEHMTTPQETPSPETLKVKADLLNLNQEVLKNPQNFKEIANKIGSLAINYFCQEMDYDPKSYEGKTFFEWGEDYLGVRNEKNDCISTYMREDNVGTVTYNRNEMIFNLTVALYPDQKNKQLNNYPAISLFAAIVHEALHASPPNKSEANKDIEVKLRGMGTMVPAPSSSGWIGLCYVNARKPLEEAIVEDASQRLMRRLGLPTNVDPNSDYYMWVSRYRMGVIDRFFAGDHITLLKLHQQTKQEDFFKLIGERMGLPPEKQAQEAEIYLSRLLLQGIF